MTHWNITKTTPKNMYPSFLTKLYEEWFSHPSWWFGCTEEDDAYLSETYGSCLQSEYETYDEKTILIAKVILYDQIPRHVQRHCIDTSNNIDIEMFRKKACETVNKCMTDDSFWKELTGTEFGFLMLPYRHSYKWPDVYKAIQYTWKKISYEKELMRDEYIHQLRPFLKATFARCPMASWTEGIETKVYECIKGNRRDWKQFQEAFSSILDYSPMHVRLDDVRKDPELNSMIRIIENSIKNNGLSGKSIIVSLSGGVDSMVILWILSYLKDMYSLKLGAVHINYCNRSDMEEDFVVSWCTSIGIDIYVRRIREIQRNSAMNLELREIYETYTRDCRYNTYREVWNILNSESNSYPWVTLGHNQDDCFENIITNLCHKQKYECLTGMNEVGNVSEIRFWRPMLSFPKKDIYTFAKKIGIPYLHDSTPSWSCRGKIRDNVRPVLENFNGEMIKSFFHMSDTMSELMNHVKCMVDIAYQKTRQNSKEPAMYTFTFSQDMPKSLLTSEIFWKMYLYKLWNTMPSVRSVRHYCERMKKLDSENTKMHIVLTKGKEGRIHLQNNEILFTWIG